MDVWLVFGSVLKVKSMQKSETEAIRTQIQPSKPKREITKITNSQNTKRTYGQPNEQLFPKSCVTPKLSTFKLKPLISSFLKLYLWLLFNFLISDSFGPLSSLSDMII